jgi:hypothetical protein
VTTAEAKLSFIDKRVILLCSYPACKARLGVNLELRQAG